MMEHREGKTEDGGMAESARGVSLTQENCKTSTSQTHGTFCGLRVLHMEAWTQAMHVC
jgi:hypothetical protein